MLPVLFIFSGCDVQQYQQVIHLSSPLALQVASSTNDDFISLQFEGFNKESYFSGYMVFFSTNTNINSGSTNWVNVYNPSISSGDTNLLTLPVSAPVSGETTYTLSVYSDMISPYILANDGKTVYYFIVEAYSSQYGTNSLPSEIAGTNYIGP